MYDEIYKGIGEKVKNPYNFSTLNIEQ